MRKAILTMGLPAAGKSYILQHNYNLEAFTVVDPDEIKKEKPDYDPKNPQVYHAWSQSEAKKRIEAGMAAGENIIIDGTGTNVEKMYKYITDLQRAGYVAELLFVRCSLETSLRRNAERERTVPEHVIYEKHETIKYAVEILFSVADVFTIIDND